MTRGCARVVIIAVLLGTPARALAQTAAGSIAGVVRDTTGAILPGVTVEASSPALIEKVRAARTDAEGRYQITELRPGIYVVTFALEGFSSVRREGIELNTGFTAAINAELRVGSVAETITVSGQSPVVDLQNTKQQVVVTRDVIESVPTGRSFQNLGVLIPGVSGGQVVGSPVNQDVGGSSGQSFMTLAIHGGRQTDQRIDLDGMSTSAWTRPDSSAVVFTDGNIEEYNISVAAASADTETGGVRINLIPREGSNTFKGGFFANWASPTLQSENNTQELRDRNLRDANKLDQMWSLNPTFGGPIQRDRLWFFGTYTYTVTDQLVGGVYTNVNPAAWDYVPDLTRQAVDDQYSKDISTRLTWQATARNKIAGYLSYNNSCHCHFLVGRSQSPIPITPDASVLLHIPNKVGQVTWSSPITNRLLAEAGGSYILEDQQFEAQPESVAPQITDPIRNVIHRAAISNMRAYTPVYGSRGSVSYVTGSHAIKVGYTLTMGTYEQTLLRVGNMAIVALNGVPSTVTYYGTPTLAVNKVWPNLGLYAQDQWTVNRFTVNGGLRLDYFRSNYPDQNVAPTEFVTVTRSFPGQEVVSWKDLNPRLGVAYDLFGTGKTAVKASVNRYVLGEGTGRASTINPIQSNNTMTRTWVDNGDRIIQGDPLNPAENQELRASQNPSFGKPVLTARYDPEWSHGFQNRPYNWEFSAGVQHELMPRMSVNAAYFRRIYGNFTATDSVLVGPNDYTSYCVDGPVDTRLPDGGSERICGLRDINSVALAGQLTADRMTTFARNYGAQYEHWNGVDLTVNARLPKVLLQGGVSTGSVFEDNCGVVRNLPEAAAATSVNSDRFCSTKSPYLTQVKMLGAYTLPFDIQLSGTFQTSPGPEITASGTFTNAQVLPSLNRTLSTAQNVSVGLVEPKTQYGERMYQVDFRFGKRFTVNRTRLQVTADLYNALNANAVLVQSNTYGATTGAQTGSAWLQPQAILPARIVKFGVQMSF
jgi:hypothetical protein